MAKLDRRTLPGGGLALGAAAAAAPYPKTRGLA